MVRIPIGYYPIPRKKKKLIKAMEDKGLIDKCIEEEKRTSFINPHMYQEILNRGLQVEYGKIRDKEIRGLK